MKIVITVENVQNGYSVKISKGMLEGSKTYVAENMKSLMEIVTAILKPLSTKVET